MKLLIFSVILFFSCITDKVENQKNTELPTQTDTLYAEGFYRDTSVNSLVLFNPESINLQFGDVTGFIAHDEILGDVVTILNKTKSEKLNMKIEYGGSTNSFMYFYVEQNDVEEKELWIHSGFESFKSSSGCEVGMSLDDFKNTNNSTSYSLIEEGQISQYHYEDNSLYQADYYFKNGKLFKYSFGYTLP